MVSFLYRFILITPSKEKELVTKINNKATAEALSKIYSDELVQTMNKSLQSKKVTEKPARAMRQLKSGDLAV